MSHQPGIDVGEHGGRQAMGAGIRLEGDAEPAGTQGGDVAAGVVEGRPGVPRAVHDQDRQVATGSSAGPEAASPTGNQPLIATTPANRSG